MNEKIKELVARGQVKIDVHTGYRFFTRDELEKFAQMIIRECALQCQHNDDMDRIENHFGVER